LFRSPPRALVRPAVPAARARVATVLLVAATYVLAAGCDKGVPFLRTNTPPTITLTSGPIDTVTSSLHWIVDIAWTAHDPDGSIDHFEYAIDPPTLKQARFALADTVWVSTTATHITVRFRASVPDTLAPGASASSFHTFVLRAIDNRAAASPLVIRAFYATTVAPDIEITRPRPSPLVRWQMPVPFRVQWESDDPDGAGSHQPAFHRWRLIDLDVPGSIAFLLDPDSLIRQGLATDWADWQTVGGDTTFLDVYGLEPGSSAALAVLAVDEAGATTPYLSLNRNFLQFTTTLPSAGAPRIHVYSPYVNFTYESSGWSTDPLREIPVELGTSPSGFQWSGIPAPGRALHSSRWMLDGDPLDESARTSPNDLAHWSEWGPPEGSAQLPALAVGVHRFYIELRDDFDGRSLGIVRLTVVDATLDRELLVVDDTRLEVDKFSTPGTLNMYTQPWPSATELDTFLFARGGYPWRGTRNPPAGLVSGPGLLAGYPFDTLGTRLGLEDPADAVTLAQLSRYRHVLWLVDAAGASYFPALDQRIYPMTALRAISSPGRSNVLAAYVELGGHVWLAGGGAAFATLMPYNHSHNDTPSAVVIASELDELGPGRVMYEHAHVRSSMNFWKDRNEPTRSARAVGRWTGHGPSGTLSAPDYAKLPLTLRLRNAGMDPLPPTRTAGQTGLFYNPIAPKEFVLGPNSIVEDMDPDPIVVRMESTLDTLYEAPNPMTPGANGPVMLYYHGRDNVPFVFTGLDLWTWTRGDCQGLVDFVLQDIWGLAKSGPESRPSRAAKPGSAALRGMGGSQKSIAPSRRVGQLR
jgi:hypothetical protein